jgi:hypothetical protein
MVAHTLTPKYNAEHVLKGPEKFHPYSTGCLCVVYMYVVVYVLQLKVL